MNASFTTKMQTTCEISFHVASLSALLRFEQSFQIGIENGQDIESSVLLTVNPGQMRIRIKHLSRSSVNSIILFQIFFTIGICLLGKEYLIPDTRTM